MLPGRARRPAGGAARGSSAGLPSAPPSPTSACRPTTRWATVAAEAVELPDEEHVVPFRRTPQAAVETRPVVAEAGGA